MAATHFKKITGYAHLWLGMACGLVVVVSMLAAAIFAWEEELTGWYYHDAVYVAPQQTILPFSVLYKKAQAALPGKTLYGAGIQNAADRAYKFTAYKDYDTLRGWTLWHEMEYFDNVYINPYTGEVTGVVNQLQSWIELSRRLHQNLLLRYDVGHYIVGFATVAVLVMVVTGLILWFPKNKAALKQRFTIKWNARWRRINYDVHNVGGFYSWLLILFFSLTGLVWTFGWWNDTVYRMLGADAGKVSEQHAPLRLQGGLVETALDKAVTQLPTLRTNWTYAYFYVPRITADTISEMSLYLNFNNHSGWDERDVYHFHPKTGVITTASLHEAKTTAERWSHSNYAMHVGSIYGLPTKIIATFAALFLASLPVTGVMIWWGRRKKTDRKPGVAAVPATHTKAPKPRRHYVSQG